MALCRFLFVLCLLSVARLSGTEASYLHYSVDQGLPSNEVYDVYEDSAGYIWFATDHGISRFDGYSFTNFSTNDGLVHNTIFGFYEDHRGWIWMRAFNSSMCYMRDGKIYPWKHNDKLKQFLGRDFVQRYAFDKAGNLWFIPITATLGLYCQNATTGEISREKIPYGYNGFIRVFDSGEMLGGIDLDNGFNEHSVINDSVITDGASVYFKIAITEAIIRRQLMHCRKTNEHNFVFVYDKNLITIENGAVAVRQIFPDVVSGYYIDPSGQHWIYIHGFSKYTPGKIPDAPYLQSYIGVSMKRDRMGNYWFATLTEGVFLARDMQVGVLTDVQGQTIDHILHLDLLDSFLICMDNKNRIFQIPDVRSQLNSVHAKYWATPFVSLNTFIVQQKRNLIFLYTSRFRISADGINAATEPLKPGIILPGIRDFHIAGDSLYMAGNSTWGVANKEDQLVYSSQEEAFRGFCTAITTDAEHHVWIGTSDGLYHFENNRTVPFRPNDSLFRTRVTDIGVGPGNEIIVSTRGGGVLIVDKDSVYEIRASDGLASDQCGNICVDGNVLWVCSNNGLTKVEMSRQNNMLSFLFNRFTLQHGLPSVIINDAIRVGDKLFLATGHGLAWFNAETFLFNVTPPPVFINSFDANSRTVSPDSTLQWSDRNISIGYVALLFKSPGLVHYRYKLEGYESEWHYTTERLAHYFNLPPGSYRFVVSAMNENGIWNEVPAVREFAIPAHYSETWWFRFLIVALIVTVLIAIAALYLRQQRTKAKATLDLALAEQKALRAQMKPHFIFNSLNSIQNFIINRDEDSAHLYLTSFAQLMRRILDHSRTGSISLEEEIETMRIYLDLEKLRFGNNFNFSIDIQNGISTSALQIPPLFIQPFVENAIWHGLQMQKENPTLTIDFSIVNNQLRCLITDNGIGRERAAANRKKGHISTGMKNVEERIAVLNATSREKISVTISDLRNAEGSPTGTQVEILFPVIRTDD